VEIRVTLFGGLPSIFKRTWAWRLPIAEGKVMRRWHITLLGIALSLSMCFSGYIAEAATITAEPAVKAKDDDRLPIYPRDEWQFFVSPYLWIPGINASIISLEKEVSPNVPWWDVASRLFSNAIGVMGRAEAWKGRWGVYVDGYFMYLGLSGSEVGATKDKTLGRWISASARR
jgi:hypothetical protein